MSEPRIIFIGRKPLHAYIRAVLMAMTAGDRELTLVARGNAIVTAVNVAEVCRRRNGFLASQLPDEVNMTGVEIGTEEVERDNGMGNVSVIRIGLEGLGEMNLLERDDKPDDSEE